jgi:hypothetical protein
VASKADLALIRFVTTRYRGLQGLKTVLDGVTVLSVWVILRWSPPDRRPGTFMVATLLWASLSMWGLARIRRYYADRCGRAVPPGADWYEDSVYPLAHAPYQVLLASTAISLGGAFTLLLPILTTRIAWTVWRDRPYRAHWLIPVVVGTVFTLTYFQVATAAQFHVWQWRLMVTGSVSLMIAGALDHLLLLKSLGGGAGAPSTAEYADIQ